MCYRGNYIFPQGGTQREGLEGLLIQKSHLEDNTDKIKEEEETGRRSIRTTKHGLVTPATVHAGNTCRERPASETPSVQVKRIQSFIQSEKFCSALSNFPHQTDPVSWVLIGCSSSLLYNGCHKKFLTPAVCSPSLRTNSNTNSSFLRTDEDLDLRYNGSDADSCTLFKVMTSQRGTW